jgi:hypothetical protein
MEPSMWVLDCNNHTGTTQTQVERFPPLAGG